ncbi:hypothetical protein [Lacipirellula sp.]|uniref:hypothetical protein n=1 Tax=Lacipirellula sp. TaxID=2691419 RepID=UPI003D0F4466
MNDPDWLMLEQSAPGRFHFSVNRFETTRWHWATFGVVLAATTAMLVGVLVTQPERATPFAVCGLTLLWLGINVAIFLALFHHVECTVDANARSLSAAYCLLGRKVWTRERFIRPGDALTIRIVGPFVRGQTAGQALMISDDFHQWELVTFGSVGSGRSPAVETLAAEIAAHLDIEFHGYRGLVF